MTECLGGGGGGETGDPQIKPPTSGIFRIDSRIRKFGPCWESNPISLGTLVSYTINQERKFALSNTLRPIVRRKVGTGLEKINSAPGERWNLWLRTRSLLNTSRGRRFCAPVLRMCVQAPKGTSEHVPEFRDKFRKITDFTDGDLARRFCGPVP
ncbi:hypothetical protein PR048_023425 [Dryococelus australis]|uniref:Uncharacterized protein n=1 Tax=Dryococelus australis TaxID=614101 RepID=A0ABQ9GU09_9NEOP|nr:hypothetical protein PR048_023425 [Dryococelus australis]